MNWLAHLCLSPPGAADRLGSILPDLAPAALLARAPAEFQRGIELHRRVDAFTDVHRDFRRSVRRLEPPLRRYGGIVVDVFYDYFLARDWSEIHPRQPLPDFAQDFYRSIDAFRDAIPSAVFDRLERMRESDFLCSYQTLDGIRKTLRRIEGRLSRPFPLADAVTLLESDPGAFEADFRAFFPEVQAFSAVGDPSRMEGLGR